MANFNRYEIDGLHRPMPPRAHHIPWQQVVRSIVDTLCGGALIAGLLWFGAQ